MEDLDRMRNAERGWNVTPQVGLRNPQSAFRIQSDKPHFLPDIAHRLTGERATAVGSSGEHISHSIRVGAQLLSTLVNGGELTRHSVQQHPFAVDTSPARGRAHQCYMLDGLRRTNR